MNIKTKSTAIKETIPRTRSEFSEITHRSIITVENLRLDWFSNGTLRAAFSTRLQWNPGGGFPLSPADLVKGHCWMRSRNSENVYMHVSCRAYSRSASFVEFLVFAVCTGGQNAPQRKYVVICRNAGNGARASSFL